jgi:hypothetical protein
MLWIEYRAADNSIVALCTGCGNSGDQAEWDDEKFAQLDSPKENELI